MKDIETILEESLQRLQAGESLEKVLSRYPEQAAELKPLLKAALSARQVAFNIRPSPPAQSQSLAGFLRAAGSESLGQPVQRQRRIFPNFSIQLRLAALVVILVIVAGSLGVVAVSAQSLPGDQLYPVKLVTEQTRLWLVRNPIQRLQLEQSFDQERAGEVQELIQRSRSSNVEYYGLLTQMDSSGWVVSGVKVTTTSSTSIQGGVRPGIYIQVEGLLEPDGVLVASKAWPREIQFEGSVQSINSTYWMVSGIEIEIDQNTIFTGTPGVGAQVNITGYRQANENLLAMNIEVISSPAQTPTVNTNEENGNRSGDTRTPTLPEPSQGVTQEPTDSHDTEHAQTPAKPTATGEGDGSEETSSPTKRASETPGSTKPGPTATPNPSGTPTHSGGEGETPRPTHTPAPRFTPQPTRTPAPTELQSTTHTPEPAGD